MTNRTTGIDYGTCILIWPLNNFTQQFIWKQKFEIGKRIVIFGTTIFKPVFSLKGNVFTAGSSFDQVSLLVLSSTLLLLPISSSTAVVSAMLISALYLLPSSMLAYCCSLLSAADLSMMSFCCSLLPALLSMVSFNYEWEVWAASLVLQFRNPPFVLTVLLPWFEMFFFL